MSRLFLGRGLETEADAYIDGGKSRAILVCGKRGSGKSYTLGVIAEELHRAADATILIVDPMGIYHTMSLSNHVPPGLPSSPYESSSKLSPSIR